MANKITSIEVIGSGCADCKKLHGDVVSVMKELGLVVEVGYSDNVQKALGMGVMQFPVLAINGKVVLTGTADLGKIKKVLEDFGGGPDIAGGCPCGGDCGCL